MIQASLRMPAVSAVMWIWLTLPLLSRREACCTASPRAVMILRFRLPRGPTRAPPRLIPARKPRVAPADLSRPAQRCSRSRLWPPAAKSWISPSTEARRQVIRMIRASVDGAASKSKMERFSKKDGIADDIVYPASEFPGIFRGDLMAEIENEKIGPGA